MVKGCRDQPGFNLPPPPPPSSPAKRNRVIPPRASSSSSSPSRISSSCYFLTFLTVIRENSLFLSLSPSSSLTSRSRDISLSNPQSPMLLWLASSTLHVKFLRNTHSPRHVDNPSPFLPARSTDDGDGPPRILFSSLVSVDGEACTLASAGENVSIRGGRGTDAGETGYLHASDAIVLPPRRSSARIRVHKGDRSTVRRRLSHAFETSFLEILEKSFDAGKVDRQKTREKRTYPVDSFLRDHGIGSFCERLVLERGGRQGCLKGRFNASLFPVRLV